MPIPWGITYLLVEYIRNAKYDKPERANIQQIIDLSNKEKSENDW